MMPMSAYDIMIITKRRALEAELRAQRHRLLAQAAAAEGGWMPPPITWLLRCAGRLLVASGRWLQQVGATRSSPIQGRGAAESYGRTLSSRQR